MSDLKLGNNALSIKKMVVVPTNAPPNLPACNSKYKEYETMKQNTGTGVKIENASFYFS